MFVFLCGQKKLFIFAVTSVLFAEAFKLSRLIACFYRAKRAGHPAQTSWLGRSTFHSRSPMPLLPPLSQHRRWRRRWRRRRRLANRFNFKGVSKFKTLFTLLS
jgi:hypothetical protein